MSENVYLFVPNLIGYARILLMVLSCWYMPSDYVRASLCYLVSMALDALDGHAARALNQCSKLGAMLDMLTDRCATMCLLVTLSHFYPNYMFLFQMSMTIDMASHWLHVHSSVAKGLTTHKSVPGSENAILSIYYSSKPVLFGMCLGNEVFYTMLYIYNFTPGPSMFGLGLITLLWVVTLPIALVKSGLSLLQLYYATARMVEIDTEEREAMKKR